MLMMLPFEAPTIFEGLQRSCFRMPRVVKEQKNKFENDDLFRQLSHESTVKFTGFRDRPLEERQMKFITNCQEGHTEVSFVHSGTQFTLMFNPNNSEDCNFDKELGKVHIKSGFILNGVCVLWRGWLDLQRLEGFGRLEFDEYRAYLEDAIAKHSASALTFPPQPSQMALGGPQMMLHPPPMTLAPPLPSHTQAPPPPPTTTSTASTTTPMLNLPPISLAPPSLGPHSQPPPPSLQVPLGDSVAAAAAAAAAFHQQALQPQRTSATNQDTSYPNKIPVDRLTSRQRRRSPPFVDKQCHRQRHCLSTNEHVRQLQQHPIAVIGCSTNTTHTTQTTQMTTTRTQ